MKKLKFNDYIIITALSILGILFVVKFAGPSILELYVEAGIGTCKNIPILCMSPQDKEVTFQTDEEFSKELVPYAFPGMQVYLPKGFRVAKEEIKKPYYKKKRVRKAREEAAYLVSKQKGFFISLFPQVKKQGITSNYEFYCRVMNANLNKIKNLTDAFFVIIKSIFIPDVGDQEEVKIIRFSSKKYKGFILYNLSPAGNYFDCCIFDKEDNFFKIYIKDGNCILNPEKFYTIISTVKVN